MKLGTFVQWPFLVIRNKSARTCLNIFGDSVIKILKSGKHKKWPRSRVEAEKLADLFLVFPARLET